MNQCVRSRTLRVKKMVHTCWRNCLSKDMNFVIILGVSIFLSGIAFMFVYNTTSVSSPVSDTPFLENPHILTANVSSQVNTHQFPAQENGINNRGKCDIFTGDWVPNVAPPLYNHSCRFITDHQNCIKNGRVDSDYLNWRWKPRGCELTQFDPARFLELMRNKRWAFIGDSISRNHAQSFLCLLSTVEKDVLLVHHDEKYTSQNWLFPFHNFTVFIIWSPFLAKAAIPEDLDSASSPEIELHLDTLDESWTEQYKSWDYVIFSSGKWFTRSAIYYENDTILGSHYCPKRNLTELGFDFAYSKVLRKVLGYITSSNHKGTNFYRTTSPDHFEGGEWYNGGVCRRKVPAKEGEFELNLLDKILLDIEVDEFDKISSNGVNLRLFDVNPMSLLRADGHPDVYRFYQPFGEDKNGKVVSDCMHWCLPGPIDAWNDLLMEIILNG